MTANETYAHQSVMLEEVLQVLPLDAEGFYIDATFGVAATVARCSNGSGRTPGWSVSIATRKRFRRDSNWSGPRPAFALWQGVLIVLRRWWHRKDAR